MNTELLVFIITGIFSFIGGIITFLFRRWLDSLATKEDIKLMITQERLFTEKEQGELHDRINDHEYRITELEGKTT